MTLLACACVCSFASDACLRICTIGNVYMQACTFVTIADSVMQTVKGKELMWDRASSEIRGKPSVYMSKLMRNRFVCSGIHFMQQEGIM